MTMHKRHAAALACAVLAAAGFAAFPAAASEANDWRALIHQRHPAAQDWLGTIRETMGLLREVERFGTTPWERGEKPDDAGDGEQHVDGGTTADPLSS